MYSASDRTVFSHVAVVWNHVGLTFNSRFSGWEYQMSWSNLVFVVAKHWTDVTQDPCPLLHCRSSTCPLERCWFSGWMEELSGTPGGFKKECPEMTAMQFLEIQTSRTLLPFIQEKNIKKQSRVTQVLQSWSTGKIECWYLNNWILQWSHGKTQ